MWGGTFAEMEEYEAQDPDSILSSLSSSYFNSFELQQLLITQTSTVLESQTSKLRALFTKLQAWTCFAFEASNSIYIQF
jgi:hypothetical protein